MLFSSNRNEKGAAWRFLVYRPNDAKTDTNARETREAGVGVGVVMTDNGEGMQGLTVVMKVF